LDRAFEVTSRVPLRILVLSSVAVPEAITAVVDDTIRRQVRRLVEYWVVSRVVTPSATSCG